MQPKATKAPSQLQGLLNETKRQANQVFFVVCCFFLLTLPCWCSYMLKSFIAFWKLVSSWSMFSFCSVLLFVVWCAQKKRKKENKPCSLMSPERRDGFMFLSLWRLLLFYSVHIYSSSQHQSLPLSCLPNLNPFQKGSNEAVFFRFAYCCEQKEQWKDSTLTTKAPSVE